MKAMTRGTRRNSSPILVLFLALLAAGLVTGFGCGEKESESQAPVTVSKVVRQKIIMEPFPEPGVAVAVKTPGGEAPKPPETAPAPPPVTPPAGPETVPPKPPMVATAPPVAPPPRPPKAPAGPEDMDMGKLGIAPGEDATGSPEDLGDLDALQIEKKYTYISTGKANPFEPPVEKSTGPTVNFRQPPKRDTSRIKTPLEKFELSQLRLVAIIHGKNNAYAMVQEPTGKGYVIRQGTYIGTNEGQVSKILKDRIVVEELQTDLMGRVSNAPREMMLQKSAGD